MEWARHHIQVNAIAPATSKPISPRLLSSPAGKRLIDRIPNAAWAVSTTWTAPPPIASTPALHDRTTLVVDGVTRSHLSNPRDATSARRRAPTACPRSAEEARSDPPGPAAVPRLDAGDVPRRSRARGAARGVPVPLRLVPSHSCGHAVTRFIASFAMPPLSWSSASPRTDGATDRSAGARTRCRVVVVQEDAASATPAEHHDAAPAREATHQPWRFGERDLVLAHEAPGRTLHAVGEPACVGVGDADVHALCSIPHPVQ